MFPRLMPTLVRVALAAASAMVAVLVSVWLQPYLRHTPFALFYLVTFVAAWRGGLIAGLVAAAITATQGPARLGLALDPDQLIGQEVTLAFLLVVTAVMVSTLTRAERRQRDRFASTLAAVGDAVVVSNVKGEVTYLNQAAEALLGWTLDDAAGRALEDVMPLVDEVTGEPEPIRLDLALREGRVTTIGPGLVALVRGGDRRPVEGSVTPIRNVRGRVSGAVAVLRDIGVRHQAERERRRLAREVAASRERLRQILSSVPAIVWEASGPPGSSGQQLHFVSQYLEPLTGYTTDEALKTPGFWFSTMHPDDREMVVNQLTERLRHADSAVTQFRFRAKDGRELWLESFSFIVRDARGVPSGVRGVSIDITERMRQDADRNELLSRERAARREAEEANRLKDEFLMTLSHELRTPLNAILGWACLLRDSDLPAEKQRRAIDTIERNARAQTQLIEDLLDMSRIVTGKVRLDIGVVDIAGVVHGVVEAMRPGTEAKGVRLELVPDVDIEQIPGDADRLRQVIWNLVSNAIKFTPTGGRIEVRVRQLYDRVLVAVSDTGVGIGADLLPFVFERFRQGPEGGGGLGLGLAITKQIVELHGGTIEARSLGENMGATFLAKFPLFAQRPAGPGAAEAAADGAGQPDIRRDGDLSGLRVLVVDAAPDSLELLQLMLERVGATVATAAGSREALALAGAWSPDVLVSDLSPSPGGGVELVRELRAAEVRDQTARLPAIAITAFARSEDRRVALESGFDDHIARPASPTQLIAALRSVVRSWDGRQPERPPSA